MAKGQNKKRVIILFLNSNYIEPVWTTIDMFIYGKLLENISFGVISPCNHNWTFADILVVKLFTLLFISSVTALYDMWYLLYLHVYYIAFIITRPYCFKYLVFFLYCLFAIVTAFYIVYFGHDYLLTIVQCW